MSNTTGFVQKWKDFWGKVNPVFQKIGEVIRIIGLCIFRLRKIFMAIPVVYFALKFASDNMERLPETVGLNLQASGEFAVLVTRNYAVYGPLGVTAFCLLLMFASRKTVFPWIVSIFTLVLPWLIYLTNLYAM